MKSPRRIGAHAAAAALAIASTACAHSPASDATPSYTAAQAATGQTAFEGGCVVCHTTDLTGARDAPPLAGPTFATRWDGRPVADLTGFMREHMPRTLPGGFNDRTYLGLVAYLLAQNGMPAGGAPLTLDATWTISIQAR